MDFIWKFELELLCHDILYPEKQNLIHITISMSSASSALDLELPNKVHRFIVFEYFFTSLQIEWCIILSMVLRYFSCPPLNCERIVQAVCIFADMVWGTAHLSRS